MSQDRSQVPYRLSPDQQARLKKAAKFEGLTMQGFIHRATMAELAEVEARMKAEKQERQSRREARDARLGGGRPQGLGLGLGLGGWRTPPEEDTPQEAPPPAQAPVVVNVGGAQAVGQDLILGLAEFVVSGPEYAADDRLRQAAQVLRASASGAELERLAARLDEEITKKRAKSGVSSMGSIGRIAYDKVRGLLGG